MDITLYPSSACGTLRAISSKSAAHRILIAAAFAEGQTRIFCESINNDIKATADCLCALGADIKYNCPYFTVTPILTPKAGAVLECGESGSTLRFLLPIIPALGTDARFSMRGRLPSRPLSPLYECLCEHGALLGRQGSNPLLVGGKLDGGDYRIRADVSSQFISGLLFALCVSGLGGRIRLEGKIESAPYIDMTLDALSLFGASIQKTEDGYAVPKNISLISPSALSVEGDWSNAAFPLCMGALSDIGISVSGLDPRSKQGDKQIAQILTRFGATITEDGDCITVRGGNLHGIELDASQIPDLVPVICSVASLAEGTTHIFGASRLRLKESDRIESTCTMLSSLGADIKPTEDGMVIVGKKRLSGGTASSFSDHRIAMSAAVASLGCEGPVTISGAECVEKSYPAFWEHIKALSIRSE